jgi:hypothetical protein
MALSAIRGREVDVLRYFTTTDETDDIRAVKSYLILYRTDLCGMNTMIGSGRALELHHKSERIAYLAEADSVITIQYPNELLADYGVVGLKPKPFLFRQRYWLNTRPVSTYSINKHRKDEVDMDLAVHEYSIMYRLTFKDRTSPVPA